MDYLSLKAAVAEAQRTLKKRRATDSFQVSESEAVFVFGKGSTFLLSIDPGKGGIYLLEGTVPTGHISTTMTDLLRSRIKGAELNSIGIPEEGERIVHLSFAPGWPDRAGTPVTVVLEIMGRHSNLLVLESNRILAALKTVPPGKSRVRPVVPGEEYRSPPPRSSRPLNALDADSLPEPGASGARQLLLDTVSGLSPFTASLALRGAEGKGKGGLYEELKRMDRESDGGSGYILRSGGRCFLTPFEPLKIGGDEPVRRLEPFSRAARAWKSSETTINGNQKEQDQVTRTLLSRTDHIRKALEQLEKEKERCRGFAENRVMAEALLIHANSIEQGLPSATLPDPYGGDQPITVPLDPKYTPLENANRLFSTARRLERGLTELEARGKELLKELDGLNAAREALHDKGDTEPARRILGDERVDRGGGSGRQDTGYRGPGRRKVVDGFTILVGKSSTDNEKVTFKAAGPNDLWLHARDYPGSHVVILTQKRHVPDRVLYAAAALAAEGSGAKNDTAPEIMVTERKWVKKLKGGKPGQVTVEKFRTVRPRRDR